MWFQHDLVADETAHFQLQQTELTHSVLELHDYFTAYGVRMAENDMDVDQNLVNLPKWSQNC